MWSALSLCLYSVDQKPRLLLPSVKYFLKQFLCFIQVDILVHFCGSLIKTFKTVKCDLAVLPNLLAKCDLALLPNLLAKCDLAVLPNLLAKCDLAVLPNLLAKCDLASSSLANIAGSNINVTYILSKFQAIKVLYVEIRNKGCMSIKKVPMKIATKMMRAKFAGKTCDNVFLPLLLRLANDVEENPGPTVYDVVDPSNTICADFSQDNRRLFKHNAGKQCVGMSLTSILHSKVKNVNEWDSSLSFLNLILCSGNNLYSYISMQFYWKRVFTFI